MDAYMSQLCCTYPGPMSLGEEMVRVRSALRTLTTMLPIILFLPYHHDPAGGEVADFDEVGAGVLHVET